MNNPKLYTVFYKVNDEVRHFETNNEETADRKSIIKNGTVYIDTRYAAKVRLYNYINRIR